MNHPETQAPVRLKIKKMHPDAEVPQYQTSGAACFDLHALLEGRSYYEMRQPACTFRTGLAVEVPQGHVLLIFSRSGHGFGYDVRLANCVGVIDSDYRGELMVRLTADRGVSNLVVHTGDRIAQAMLVPIPRVEFDLVDELSSTARGTGGFGSTGA